MQIAEDPERVALDGLAHAIELTLRSLVAIHPGLGQPADRPFAFSDTPKADQAPDHRLVMCTAQEAGSPHWPVAARLSSIVL